MTEDAAEDALEDLRKLLNDGELDISKAFIDAVKKDEGRQLYIKKKDSLLDKDVVSIIDKHFKADDITSVYLGECPNITDATLVYIADKCSSQLISLTVSACDQITDDGIKAIVEKVGYNLEVFNYSHCKCTDAAIHAVVQNCPNMEDLNAEKTGITLIPENIGQKMPKLHTLYLKYNEIKRIPLSFTLLINLDKFRIDGMNILEPPSEVLRGEGIELIKSIFEYFAEQQGRSIDAAHVNSDGGISDSPAFDPDRLGRNAYAEGISTVARAIESPDTSICIGLYGRWGSGKSFLYKLIRKADEAWTNQQLAERLEEIKKEEEENKSFLLQCNDCSLQFTCNAIFLLARCCCCFLTKGSNPSPTTPDQQAKSIATLFTLFFPIWTCFYLGSLPFIFIKEILVSTIKIRHTLPLALFFPIWTCLYLVRFPLNLVKELFIFIKNWLNKNSKIRATLKALFFPIWLCHYLVSLLYNFVKKKIFIDEVEQTDLPQNKKPTWRDVRDLLTGNTPVYSGETPPWSSCCSLVTFHLLVLSSTQTFFKMIRSIVTRTSIFFPNFLCCMKPLKEDDVLRKPLYIECNAWLYNGTDLLWASLLEKIWTKVEEEFGPWRVRFHRFTVEISGESQTDDRKMKEWKRNIALIKFVLRQIFYFLLAIAITVLITIYNKEIKDIIDELYLRYILYAALYASPVFLFVKDVIKVFSMLARSKGSWILEQARSLEKHQRADLSQKTGFMGIVKIEVEYLIDFMRTQYITDWKHQLKRLARLFILVDDLDRCDVPTIMNVLQAVMLLLLGVDAPFTILLAIDSRVIVTSIEMYFGEHFRQEGIDGYSFLDKIVQLPFCIPDLDIRRKTKFLRTIFEKKELDPFRICKRLEYYGKDNNKKFPEFEKLVPPSFKNSKNTPKEEELKKEDMIKELVDVLDEMIKMKGILEHNDADEACFGSPRNVFEKVRSRVKHQQALGDQLEEEFLSYVSCGIQKMLLSSKSRTPATSRSESQEDPSSSPTTTQPAATTTTVDEEEPTTRPSPTTVVNEGDNQQGAADDGSTEDDVESTSSTTAPPGAAGVEKELSDPIRSKEETIYKPLMDDSESSWFKEYADHLVGEPRKMKRIVNSYSISRVIADKLSPNLTGSAADVDFRRKLMKMIILFEQWPYRMAWLMVIVENVQQELSLKKKSTNGNPIGKNMTSIISELLIKDSKVAGEEKEIMSLPLLDVYYRLVQTLIHSPTNASVELQRDGDAQVFEILLAESVVQLEMRDIASVSCGGGGGNRGLENRSIRPYVFNLQMHMIDKVEKYVDNCMVHVSKDNNQHQGLQFGVYQPKKSFFNQDYPTSFKTNHSTSQSEESNQSQPNLGH